VSERIDYAIDYFVGNPEFVRMAMFRLLAGLPDPRQDLWDGFVARIRRLAESPGSRDQIDPEMLAQVLIPLIKATEQLTAEMRNGKLTAVLERIRRASKPRLQVLSDAIVALVMLMLPW